MGSHFKAWFNFFGVNCLHYILRSFIDLYNFYGFQDIEGSLVDFYPLDIRDTVNWPKSDGFWPLLHVVLKNINCISMTQETPVVVTEY